MKHDMILILALSMKNENITQLAAVPVALVNYKINVTHSGSHLGINGASASNRNIIVTLQSPNIQRTTCHEMSHWIGASDLSCVNGQACVMTYGSNVYNVWCAQCAQAIVNFLD